MTALRPPSTLAISPTYEHVVGEFGDALSRLLVGYEANADLRNDLLQEIHVAIWRSLPSFEGRCSLRTWVYRIAHNVAIDYVVHRSRDGLSRCLSLEFAAETLAREDTAKIVEESGDVARLALLIRRLKPADRQVILLYLEGFEHAEIADVCGISIENAATKTHRVKQALRAMFEQGGHHAS